MQGHQSPPGPSSDAAGLCCAVCPGSPKGHGTGFGAMNWSPPPDAAELPPWSWLAPRATRVDPDTEPYLRVIHEHLREIARVTDMPYHLFRSVGR